MSKPQIILGPDGEPAFAVLPWDEYKRLDPFVDESLLTDEELYDRAKAEGGEYFPMEVVDRILNGENKIKVFREYRGLTQVALAEAASINPVYLSQIENGKRQGSVKTLSALARALNLDLDDLVDIGD